jgi:N-acylneuraminate cytidylyltransferase
VLQAFRALLVEIPGNRFYRRHFDQLHPLFDGFLMSWGTANRFEAGDDEEQLRIARSLAALHTAALPIPVKAVVTDFDGVHTDDTATIDADGGERVQVSREDGMGVALLRRAGVPMLILSTEVNPVVRARADKLQVPVLHGIDDKAAALRIWAAENRIDLADVAYLGNDVNDLPAMRIVGWPVAVADAHPLVIEEARAVLSREGGKGAVRELVERVLSS